MHDCLFQLTLFVCVWHTGVYVNPGEDVDI